MIRWLMRPIPYAVLAGVFSVGLSLVFGWVHGWLLLVVFVAGVGGSLAVDGLYRLIYPMEHSPKARSEATQEDREDQRDPS